MFRFIIAAFFTALALLTSAAVAQQSRCPACACDMCAGSHTQADFDTAKRNAVKLGYPPMEVGDLLLDLAGMPNGQKLSIIGQYYSLGRLHLVATNSLEVIYVKNAEVARDWTTNSIPILTNNAQRDSRAMLLNCDNSLNPVGCGVMLAGHKAMCNITNAFGMNTVMPCIEVEW